MSEIFKLSVDDGIATITWDLPGASMNVLNEQGIRELTLEASLVMKSSVSCISTRPAG